MQATSEVLFFVRLAKEMHEAFLCEMHGSSERTSPTTVYPKYEGSSSTSSLDPASSATPTSRLAKIAG